ncbi:MAG TPA: alpha-L-rhamnosidase C-terminal domain-containing protein [Phycisphaerae bacterium]|nr:alpha-L-rhamnosidase C-terminal domain-containing protein [Phycisphaerae bacterium]
MGWSGIPAYFYGAYVLGVKPQSDGFRIFHVAPAFHVCSSASGTVPTQHGNIEISWWGADNEFHGKLRHPAAITPKFSEAASTAKWEISQS